MSQNQNRKYLTSTGVLLKALADDPKSSVASSSSKSHQSYPHSMRQAGQPLQTHSAFHIHSSGSDTFIVWFILIQIKYT